MSDPPANMSLPNDAGTSNGACAGDVEAMDAICRLLNTVGCAADVAEGIAMIVAGTGRPYVDDLAVIAATVGESVHGLPRADVLVDGDVTVRVRVDRRGQVRVAVRVDRVRPVSTVTIGGVVAYRHDADLSPAGDAVDPACG